MKYRKKPVEIEAFQFGLDEKPDWFMEAVNNGIVSLPVDYNGNSHEAYIQTLEGSMLVRDTDYVIKGIKGELYPCKPDIFLATYEAA